MPYELIISPSLAGAVVEQVQVSARINNSQYIVFVYLLKVEIVSLDLH